MQSPVGIQRWGQIDTKITFKLVLQKNDSIIPEIKTIIFLKVRLSKPPKFIANEVNY